MIIAQMLMARCASVVLMGADNARKRRSRQASIAAGNFVAPPRAANLNAR